ncbi:MAG: VPLPA-CTERM sorting domain-containing protein [Pseudomonadota bacterium]
MAIGRVSAAFAAAISVTVLAATPASALLIRGEAVTNIGGATVIGDAYQSISPTDGAPLDTFLDNDPDFAAFTDEAIEYFIPLTNTDGVYGVSAGGDFGQVSDDGNGVRNASLSMFIAFRDIQPLFQYQLEIYFEDLDLQGTADGSGFEEGFNAFDDNGDSLVPGTPESLIGDDLFYDVTSSPALSGTAGGTQSLIVDLGVLNFTSAVTDYVIELRFGSDVLGAGTFSNTNEFLAPFVRQSANAVPLPPAGWMLLAGLGAMALLSRRRRAGSSA